MPASLFETILARVATLLLSATAAGSSVYRAREDAYGDDESKAINLRRQPSSADVIGSNGQRDVLTFDLEFFARGAAWETDADSLHMEAHALLLADATLASLVRGLRCTGTEPQGDSADSPAGRLTAHYQMQIFVRPGDLTVAA